jgi:hypothetical protein
MGRWRPGAYNTTGDKLLAVSSPNWAGAVRPIAQAPRQRPWGRAGVVWRPAPTTHWPPQAPGGTPPGSCRLHAQLPLHHVVPHAAQKSLLDAASSLMTSSPTGARAACIFWLTRQVELVLDESSATGIAFLAAVLPIVPGPWLHRLSTQLPSTKPTAPSSLALLRTASCVLAV